jgi:hypothetical protein
VIAFSQIGALVRAYLSALAPKPLWGGATAPEPERLERVTLQVRDDLLFFTDNTSYADMYSDLRPAVGMRLHSRTLGISGEERAYSLVWIDLDAQQLIVRRLPRETKRRR